MNNSFVICAFVTESTPYEQVAKEYLLPSLKENKIEYDLEIVPNLGSWIKNTAYKATFARLMLEKHTGKNIVLLDADSRIFSYPIIFDNIPIEFDIGAFILDRNVWYNNDYGDQRYEFLSGTLFIRNSAVSHYLVKEWENRCKDTGEWEQKILAKVLKERNVPIFKLPMAYCYITSLPDGSSPNIVCENPVICHYQMSRKYRNIIK
jgi:hypothetical protein